LFTEPLEVLNLLTNSPNESSKVVPTSKSIPVELYLSNESSLLGILPPAPNISIASGDISNTSDEFQNFEFQTKSISKSIVNTTSLCHNFELEHSDIMESDFDDDDKKTSPNMADITKLLASLSQQISNQSNFIQDQLLKQQSIIDHQADNDLKLQSVLQDNESFK
jgi:hypothetical protein